MNCVFTAPQPLVANGGIPVTSVSAITSLKSLLPNGTRFCTLQAVTSDVYIGFGQAMASGLDTASSNHLVLEAGKTIDLYLGGDIDCYLRGGSVRALCYRL